MRRGATVDPSAGLEAGVFRDREHPAYQALPSRNHEKKGRRALERLAGELSRPAEGETPYRVRLYRVRNAFASPVLDGFVLPPPEDGPARPSGLDYAVVVNHPVEIQTASVLDVLSEVVERRRSRRPRGREVVAADENVDARTVDRLRYGWRTTARLLARRAADSGLPLEVRLEPAFVLDDPELAPRLAALRRLYDGVSEVRRRVDRLVAALLAREDRAVRDQRPVGGGWRRAGGPDPRWTAVLPQQRAAVLRDALVCGNGYLVQAPSGGEGPRVLPPEAVEICADGSFRWWDGDRKVALEAGKVVHRVGFRQAGGEPGLGVLEPLLTNLLAVERALERDEPRRVEREAAILFRRAERFLGWWESRLPAPPLDLYLPGRRRIFR